MYILCIIWIVLGNLHNNRTLGGIEKNEYKIEIYVEKNLVKVINSLEEENKQLKNKMKEKEHDNLILLNNSIELRRKIKDLENNIEFLVNNLSSIKKKKIGL